MMDWKSVGDVVKKSAPLLGAVLGGPAGGAVGGAVSILLGAFGLGSDATPEQALQVITMDPASAVKLRELDNTHKVELGKLALQADQMQLADVQNARQREIELTKATGGRDTNLYVLAWTVVAGFFLLCAVLMRFSLPDGSNDVVFMLFGALSTGFGTVLQYFFGSSKSSSDKTIMMAGVKK